MEGFGHLVKVDGDWPRAGSRVLWDAPPKGRGRVVETVDAFEARTGQTVHIEDEHLRGSQTVTFSPGAGGGVKVTVALDVKRKEGNPVSDWLFVRRRVGEALRRTLVKYRIERLADLDDERTFGNGAP